MIENGAERVPKATKMEPKGIQNESRNLHRDPLRPQGIKVHAPLGIKKLDLPKMDPEWMPWAPKIMKNEVKK